MSPVRYELGVYTTEDGILHSHGRENFESYIFAFILDVEVCRIYIALQHPAERVQHAERRTSGKQQRLIVCTFFKYRHEQWLRHGATSRKVAGLLGL
jgi:hypothetical protein